MVYTLYINRFLLAQIFSQPPDGRSIPKTFTGLPVGLSGPDVLVGKEDHRDLTEPDIDSIPNRRLASVLRSSTVRIL